MNKTALLEQAKPYIGAIAGLPEMLDARERRVLIQKKLIDEFHTSLVSFTLNIPGPVKVLPLVPEAFSEGISKITEELQKYGLSVLHVETQISRTGLEAFFSVDAPPENIKSILVPIEDRDRVGRLYDIDIIRTDGTKVSRKELGLPVRECLLCKKPAYVCSRSRSHTVEELTGEIGRILSEHLFE